MERKPVSSSLLTSMGYDPETQTLEVEFTSTGAVWQYTCSPSTYARVRQADSIGRAFMGEIQKKVVGERIS